MEQIFSPKICVPQLLAPLNLMFCAASLCQDNSSESSPIMRDEVGEHMAWDLRPFLHAVSLQLLQILRSTFVDSASAHPTDFLWGLCRGTVMAMAVNHFCVDFEVYFGSLTCWKVQPQPILSLLEGAVRFSFNICWYLMESMIPRSEEHTSELQSHLNLVC